MNRPLTSVSAAQEEEEPKAAALLVAGMHRSGTSALTRVVSILGVDLPRTLAGSRADNPKGFWEPAPAAALNDQLLTEIGTSWEDVLAFIASRGGPTTQAAAVTAIADVIKSEFSLRRSVVIKDPRMALLLDLWIAAVGAVPLEAKVIVPVRNPLEVAASLKRREGFAIGRSLLLWLTYFLAAERSSRGLPRVFINFSDLLDDWRGQMRRLEGKLDFKFPRWTTLAELEVDDFLTELDRHHHASEALVQSRADVPNWVKDAYAWSLRASSEDAEPAAEALDAIAAEFSASERVFAPLISDLGREVSRLASAETSLRSAEGRLLAVEAELSAKDARLETLHSLQQDHALESEQRTAAEALVQEQRARIAALEGSLHEAAANSAQIKAGEERIHYLEEKVRVRDDRIAQFRNRLATNDARTEHLESELAKLEQRLEADAAKFELQSEKARNLLESTQRRSVAAVGRSVAEAAASTRLLQREVKAARLAMWLAHPVPRKRFARVIRSKWFRPLMRRTSGGRAVLLLASGLYAPADGPGGRAIVSYARKPAGLSAHPLFDDAFYRQSALSWPGAAEQSPAAHYIWSGDREGRQPHQLFDARWYRETYGEALVGWPLTALEHYIIRGAREGLAPHPLFDSHYYVSQSEEVASRGENPLAHYCRVGWRELLRPHPLFDPAWYYERNPDVREAGVPALLHFVTNGYTEGRDPHPLFSTSYYLSSNPDVAEAQVNPLVHYVINGWREGRRPSEYFDPVAYLKENPDVDAAGVEPLTHYLANGAWEERGGAGPYDRITLFANYPVESGAGMAPLEAWVRAGAPDLPEGDISARSVISGGSAFDVLADARAEPKDNYDWPAYERLSAALQGDERERLKNIRPKQFTLLDCGSDAVGAAKKLRFEERARPDVSIIIPVFNQLKYTVECLTSIALSADGTDIEVIVIDDASTDGTSKILSDIPGLGFLRNESNLGYLHSVNRAAETARGRVLVLLNNDAQVLPGWLAGLLRALEDDTVGIAAPKMLFPNGWLQEAGAKLRSDGKADMIGLFDDPTLPRYNYDRDVDYVSGACLAVRRADFEALGGFDQRFAPAYCEDSDLCLRIKAMGKRIRYVSSAQIVHHLSVSSDARGKAYKTRQATKNQQLLVERWGEELEKLDEVRVISFYLPQFHAIRENDAWWGAGFTEWRNVARALPNFTGHYQPHAPGELGYYDLSTEGVLQKQAALARQFGIHGFCYYYYWFDGRRVLEAPIERMLESGKPDLPFCLCWANENWTRAWDGQSNHVLLKQNHSDQDDAAVIADVIRYLRSPSYIRINGKPLFVVYRPQVLPNPRRTAEMWRRACREAGIGEIYLAMVEVFEHALTYPNPADFGFDASIEFPPSGMSAPMDVGEKLNPDYSGTICDYHQIVRRYLREPLPAHTRFRGAMPSWDNTARRQDKSYVFQGATPGAFQAWLERIIAQTRQQNFGDERLIFVNAWNEWAEGAHLEPDLRFGRGWLEAVRNALDAEALLRGKER